VVEALVVQAETSELTRVYDWAETLGRRFDVPQSTLFAIQLCFEEALSNIARFGFADVENEVPRNTDVRLTVEPRGDQIVATIEDHGDAFDPLLARIIHEGSAARCNGGDWTRFLRRLRRG
jgi:anti-sigma regulatory factor (Ser/Thr protein kinase)